MGFGGLLCGILQQYLMPFILYHLEVIVNISKTADLMPLFFVSYIHSIRITVKLLSASRPLLLKILNNVLKFSVYRKCLSFLYIQIKYLQVNCMSDAYLTLLNNLSMVNVLISRIFILSVEVFTYTLIS